MSIDTGYARDYPEGAAYRDYFATDRLMFQVSKTDTRLRNKAEVLVMRLGRETAQSPRVPVAIAAQFLRKHPVYTFSAANERSVVITSKAGANRVYQADASFPEQREGAVVRDASGEAWRVTESGPRPGARTPRRGCRACPPSARSGSAGTRSFRIGC